MPRYRAVSGQRQAVGQGHQVQGAPGQARVRVTVTRPFSKAKPPMKKQASMDSRAPSMGMRYCPRTGLAAQLS